MTNPCTTYYCLEVANPTREIGIFGVAEFFTAIALMILAYTFSDEIYKFRTNVVSLPIKKIFPYFFATVGLSILAVDLYFLYGMPIPKFLNHMFIFESVFSFFTILIISYWLIVAFVHPPIYSKKNCISFGQNIYRMVVNGSEAELQASAREIGRSAKWLVQAAHRRVRDRDVLNGGFMTVVPVEAAMANDIFYLMGDRRFCRTVARHAPWVAGAVFHELSVQRLGDIRVSEFARNVSYELISFEDSAIHSEDESYLSGLLGELKPITSDIFGNFDLIEGLASQGRTPLEISGDANWTSKNWSAFFGAAKVFFRAYVNSRGNFVHSYSLHRLMSALDNACMDAYKINSNPDDRLPVHKISEVADFIKESLQMLEETKLYTRELRDEKDRHQSDIYGILADAALDLLENVSSVTTNEFVGWHVQHNVVWNNVFDIFDHDNKAFSLFRFKLRRRLYNKIVELERIPGFANARLLGLLLNVMGLSIERDVDLPKEYRALKLATLSWAKRNFGKLKASYPVVAEAVQLGTITFDDERNRFVKTYMSSFGRDPIREYLDIEV